MEFSILPKIRSGGSMEIYKRALLACLLAAILSCVPAADLPSGGDPEKCPQELETFCLACEDAGSGVTAQACCTDADAQQLCHDVLSGNDLDKRAKYFLGKRTRNNFLGKRLRNNFLGKREDPAEMEEAKRRTPFLGKRDDDLDEDKRRSPFLGKRNDLQEEEDKRSRSPFLGKRSRSPFLGKRSRSPFLGKRDDDVSTEEEKRRTPFLGKRSVDDALALENEDYLEEEKRSRSPFLGKRSRSPFLGKRQRSPFLGKRADLEELEGYGPKRANYFLGKRSDENLSSEDLEALVKRAKYFLGKRPKYFLG